MKKNILLVALVLVFAGLKAQQAPVGKETSTPVQKGQTTGKEKEDSKKQPKPFDLEKDRTTRTSVKRAEQVRTLFRKAPPEKPKQKQAANTSKEIKRAGRGN